MELIGVILFCLILGIIIRKKGDNTMDTLSKGCGCFSILFIIFVGLIIWMLIEGY